MNNGHSQDDKGRLDRIEGIIEALATRQADLEDEFARLLKAQIVIGDETGRFIKETRLSIAKLAEAQAATDERLNALIDYFQRHLDDHAKGGN